MNRNVGHTESVCCVYLAQLIVNNTRTNCHDKSFHFIYAKSDKILEGQSSCVKQSRPSLWPPKIWNHIAPNYFLLVIKKEQFIVP